MPDSTTAGDAATPLTWRDIALYSLIGAISIGVGAPLALIVMGLFIDLLEAIQRAFR